LRVLHEFLTENRNALIGRCRAKVARRFEPAETPAGVDHGVPLFLQQLVETLRGEQSTPHVSNGSDAAPAATPIGRAAAVHGAELLRLGFSVDQVVHDYGDLCQAVTEMAGEQGAAITNEEFRTLNRCLDNAIADAVTAFGQARQSLIDSQAQTLNQSLNSFAVEQQRLVDIALQSYFALKTGSVGVTGATGSLLLRTLEDLRSLPARLLPDILVKAPAAPTAAKAAQ
jgi:hypothetical protein